MEMVFALMVMLMVGFTVGLAVGVSVCNRVLERNVDEVSSVISGMYGSVEAMDSADAEKVDLTDGETEMQGVSS